MKRGWAGKGQIAIFIIVGVVLIAIIIGIFYINKEGVSKTKKYLEGSIQASIVSCMEDTADDSLEVIGLQGGYYQKPEQYYHLEWGFLPYFFYEEKNLVPSNKVIEGELSKYVNDNLKQCLEVLDSNNLKLDYGDLKTKTIIKEKEILFEMDMPININNNGLKSEFELKDNPIFRTSALYDILEVANYIVDSHASIDGLMCISCLGELAEERNLYVNEFDFADDSTLVIISENHTYSKFYLFEFLEKFEVDISVIDDFADLDENIAPQLPSI